MKRYLRITILVVFAGVTACSPAATPVTSEPVSVLSPTPSQPYHSLDVQTNIEVVDQILEAVASGERQRFISLLQFTRTTCTTQDGLGGPPRCREGEAEGTPVDAFPFIGSEGGMLRRDEIEQWQGIDVEGIYAVYKVSPAVYSDENYPSGTYTILFAAGENEPAVAVRIGESGIVRIDHLFDTFPGALDQTLAREAAEILLAPVGR